MTRAGGSVVFSCADESFAWARQEIREAFGRSCSVQRLGPDLGAIDGPSVAEVAAASSQCRLVFVRHLTVGVELVPRAAAMNLPRVAAVACAAATSSWGHGASLAVQTWESGPSDFSFGSAQLFAEIARQLAERDHSVSRAGQSHVLSCCMTEGGVLVGVNDLELSLADWPGGRLRLARRPDRISRAEFKLTELLKLRPIGMLSGRALDLGAAPGGWTHVLRELGMSVVAVDPGDLDARLAADSGVVHSRQTAGTFLRSPQGTFELVVNDMRMDPLLSSQVMLQAASVLSPGGLAVVTLKTGATRPVDVTRRCLDVLASRYEVRFARQLYHNRLEITLLLQRLPTPSERTRQHG